jgi:hypothetical protein
LHLPGASIRSFLRAGPLFNAFNAVYPDDDVSQVFGFGVVHLGIQALLPGTARALGTAAVGAVAEPEGKGFRPGLQVVTSGPATEFHLFAWFMHSLAG